MSSDQLADFDRRLRAIEDSVAELRAAIGGTPAAAVEPVAPPPEAPESAAHPHRRPPPLASTRPAPEHPTERPARPTAGGPTERPAEAALGGKALAVVGGAAVLIGIVFFVAVAISRGLIPVSVRMALAAAGCALLLVLADVVRRQIGGRVLPGVLATVGILGGFATLAGTIAHYGLLPERASLAIAPAIGAIAFASAHRLRLGFLAVIGTIFTLLGPGMSGVGSGAQLATYALVVFAATCAHAAFVSWPATWIAGLLITPVFVMSWAEDLTLDSGSEVGSTAPLIATIAYLAIHLATAFVGDRRWRTERSIPPVTLAALPLGVMVAAAMGTAILTRDDQPASSRNIWMTALGGVLLVGGALHGRIERSRLIGPLTAALGFALLAVAFGMWFDGPARVIAWSAQAVAAAWAAARLRDDRALVGSAGTALAAVVAALILAPPRGLGWSIDDPITGVVAVLVVAAALALVALVTRGLDERHVPLGGNRTALVLTGASIAVLYGTSIALVQGLGTGDESTQVVLSVFWSVTGLGMIVGGLTRDRVRVRIAGLTLLGVALAKLVAFDLRYLSSMSRALAFILVGLFALSGAFAYQRVRSHLDDEDRGDARTG